jgi:hypothetical protein
MKPATAEKEKLKIVQYSEIKGRTHFERELAISAMQTRAKEKDGSSLHLIFDKRLYPQLRKVSNTDLIYPTLVQHCAKVTIINEDGSQEVTKSRSGRLG